MTFPAALLLAALAPLAEVNFTGDALTSYAVTNKGSFAGVLPKGRSDENYTGWKRADVASRQVSEAGEKFIRFDTADEPGQFRSRRFGPLEPGFYRFELKVRTWGDALSVNVRQGPAPYRVWWSESVDTHGVWSELSFPFELKERSTDPMCIFFMPGRGETDLAHLRLFTGTREEFVRNRQGKIRRPPMSVTSYLRHRRFPLGLPSGWSVWRDSVTTETSLSKERTFDVAPVLAIDSPDGGEVHTEPFAVNRPGQPHFVRVRYRAEGEKNWSVTAEAGGRNFTSRGSCGLTANGEWQTAGFKFVPKPDDDYFDLKFNGKGRICLDEVTVSVDESEVPRTPQVSLSPLQGEIASRTRIQFLDEPFVVDWAVVDAPERAELALEVVDLYGACTKLPPISVSAGTLTTGTATIPVAPNRARGQFRIEGALTANGRVLSLVEEAVVTRLPRPRYWGRRAPRSSPFGAHMFACRQIIETAKACGINSTRLHDAGLEYSAWKSLEPEKGMWRFRDAELKRFSEAGMSVFAQLGTTPAWASKFGESGLSRFDYFESYFRPTNTVDWTNYVTAFATRYRETIDEYFFWNEPWGKWWAKNADAKFYAKDRAPEDYAALQRVTFNALRAVSPQALFCGFNGNSNEGTGLWWSDGVMKGGGFDSCNAIDFHYYTPQKRCRRGERPASLWPLKPIREVHPDLGGKPVYMSEGQGLSDGGGRFVPTPLTGLYKAVLPYRGETRDEYVDMADRNVRYQVSLLSEGVAKIFLYTFHAYRTLAKEPAYLTVLGADGFAHPMTVAQAQLGAALDGLRFTRAREVGAKGMAYAFAGEGRKVVVCTDLTAAEVAAFAARPGVKAVDLFGNPFDKAVYVPGTVVYLMTQQGES